MTLAGIESTCNERLEAVNEVIMASIPHPLGHSGLEDKKHDRLNEFQITSRRKGPIWKIEKIPNGRGGIRVESATMSLSPSRFLAPLHKLLPTI